MQTSPGFGQTPKHSSTPEVFTPIWQGDGMVLVVEVVVVVVVVGGPLIAGVQMRTIFTPLIVLVPNWSLTMGVGGGAVEFGHCNL
jgi:hypothetical protein